MILFEGFDAVKACAEIYAKVCNVALHLLNGPRPLNEHASLARVLTLFPHTAGLLWSSKDTRLLQLFKLRLRSINSRL